MWRFFGRVAVFETLSIENEPGTFYRHRSEMFDLPPHIETRIMTARRPLIPPPHVDRFLRPLHHHIHLPTRKRTSVCISRPLTLENMDRDINALIAKLYADERPIKAHISLRRATTTNPSSSQGARCPRACQTATARCAPFRAGKKAPTAGADDGLARMSFSTFKQPHGRFRRRLSLPGNLQGLLRPQQRHERPTASAG